MNRKAARGSSARVRWLHLNPPWGHPTARRLPAGEIRWPGKADDMWLNEGCIVTSAFIVCREGKIGKQKKRSKQKKGTVYLMAQRVSRMGNQNQIHGKRISSDTNRAAPAKRKNPKRSNETMLRSKATSGENNKMIPNALKCYGKASRKEEKVALFISRGVEWKLHGKTKKMCPSDAKGGEEGVCPQGDHLSPDRTKKRETQQVSHTVKKKNEIDRSIGHRDC
jgi:hypothetical protein